MYTKNLNLNNKVLITLGDPAGIGIEVILKAISDKNLPRTLEPILIGCRKSIEITYANLKEKGVNDLLNLNQVKIKDIPYNYQLIPGKPNSKTGEASFKWLTIAVQELLKGNGSALVTGPISKATWHDAGYQYPGQTERLAELAGVKQADMLFTAKSPHTGWSFNTLLATTHIPLKEIPKILTPSIVNAKLNALLNFCTKYKSDPRLIVPGLNPHAGEEGKIGDEEINWLIPMMNEWKKQHPNVTLDGPISPDTCWIEAANAWKISKTNAPDGFLALYHDQGLIPVKLIAFNEAVNTTLGLPFIRTSPDHGTGFDIAGKGFANPQSMIASIKTAWELSKTMTV